MIRVIMTGLALRPCLAHPAFGVEQERAATTTRSPVGQPSDDLDVIAEPPAGFDLARLEHAGAPLDEHPLLQPRVTTASTGTVMASGRSTASATSTNMSGLSTSPGSRHEANFRDCVAGSNSGTVVVLSRVHRRRAAGDRDLRGHARLHLLRADAEQVGQDPDAAQVRDLGTTPPRARTARRPKGGAPARARRRGRRLERRRQTPRPADLLDLHGRHPEGQQAVPRRLNDFLRVGDRSPSPAASRWRATASSATRYAGWRHAPRAPRRWQAIDSS